MFLANKRYSELQILLCGLEEESWSDFTGGQPNDIISSIKGWVCLEVGLPVALNCQLNSLQT
jgi:hypothetical protein